MNSKLLKLTTSILLTFCLCILSSCSTPANVEYDLVLDIHEFEIKKSHDLFHREPEVFFKVETETKSHKSKIFKASKVDFVADATTYNIKLRGRSFSDNLEFSIDFYDYDLIWEADHIAGVTMKIDKNSGVLSETVTIDNREIFLVFTYNLQNLKFND